MGKHNSSRIKCEIAGLLSLLAILPAAHAETPPPFRDASGRLFGSVEVGVAHFAYPRNQFFADRGEASPFTRNYNLDADDGDAYGRSIAGVIGSALPLALAHADQVKVELQGWRMDADQTSNRSFVDPGAGVRYGWVQLDNATGFGTPNGDTLVTRIRQDLTYWGSDLLAAFEYTLGPDASWTWLIGPSYRSLDQDTNISGEITTSGTLTETLSTRFRGGRIGARYDRQLAGDWSLSAGGSASYYRSDADYHAVYDVPPTLITRSLSARDNVLGLDARMEVARRIKGSMKIAAYGELSHLSDVPRVSYGSVPTDPAGGVLALTNGGLTTWVLGVRLSGAF
jgi:hypothetical protein